MTQMFGTTEAYLLWKNAALYLRIRVIFHDLSPSEYLNATKRRFQMRIVIWLYISIGFVYIIHASPTRKKTESKTESKSKENNLGKNYTD